MRQLRNPRVINIASGFLASAAALAGELRELAGRTPATRLTTEFVEDAEYFAGLVMGTVAWLQPALPLADHVVRESGRMTNEERALGRLGIGAEDARLEEVVRQHYLRVLEASAWSISVAARVLGVGRRTVQRFMGRKPRAST